MNQYWFDNSQNYLKNLNTLMNQGDSLYKYKYFAINLCQDLFCLIESLVDKIKIEDINSNININTNTNANDSINININEMKDFLKMIYMDIEGMSNKCI
jgi:hypothetical protein